MTTVLPTNIGRGIESIAHLFLSQSPGPQVTPCRRPPGSADCPKPETMPEKELTLSENAPAPCQAAKSFVQSAKADGLQQAVVMLLADHLDTHWERVDQYSRRLTQQAGRAGLLYLDGLEARLVELSSGGSTEDNPALLRAADSGGLSDDDHNELLIQALRKVTGNGAPLLISVADTQHDGMRDLIRGCSKVVVFTTCVVDDLVKTYQNIKWLVTEHHRQQGISLFIFDAAEETAARRIHEKLAKTAHDFMQIYLDFDGFTLQSSNRNNKNNGQQPNDGWELNSEKTDAKREDGKDEEDGGVIEKELYEGEITEEAGELISRLLEPGLEVIERDAPTPAEPMKAPPAEAGEPSKANDANSVKRSIDVSDEMEITNDRGEVAAKTAQPEGLGVSSQREKEKEPVIIEPRGCVAGASKREGLAVSQQPVPLWPVPVAEIPRTDAALSQALQLSLPRWLTAIPSAMSLPVVLPREIGGASGDGAGGVTVLVDGNGRMYLLLASLSAEGVLERAMAARLWLKSNLELVASQWCQVRIDRSLPVGLVLAVASGKERLQPLCGQLDSFPLCLLQVHLLHGDGGSSLLVV